MWIGEEGMRADELLNLQMDNEELPEWMRVEPGELVQVRGDEGGAGLRMPEVSPRWLDGLWVYENMRHALAGIMLAELEMEVLHVFAARQGKVPVVTLLGDGEDLWHRHRQPLDGLVVVRHFDPDTDGMPGYTSIVRLVPRDRLTPADVNDELIDALELYATGSGYVYVIEDTPQARRALEMRLNS